MALPGDAAGSPIVSDAQRGRGGSRGEGRGLPARRRGAGGRRGVGAGVPLSAQPYEPPPHHCPKITIALF